MNSKDKIIIKEVWDCIHDNELAGDFPHQLLIQVNALIEPIRCAVCNGVNIRMAAWVNPNTREIEADYGSWSETDTKFCEDCQEDVLFRAPTSDELWNNNETQFARLISEMVAAGVLTLDPLATADMLQSMNAEPEYVEEIIRRAEVVFEREKARL